MPTAAQQPASFPVVYNTDTSFFVLVGDQTYPLGDVSMVEQSPNRQYVAFIEDNTLRLFSAATGQTQDIMETDYIGRVDWVSDQMVFNLDDESLFSFDLTTDTLAEVAARSVSWGDDALLPNLAEDQFRLFSPDGRYALYYRCNAGGTKEFLGETVCANGGVMVVYDTVEETALRQFPNASIGFSGAAWSPSGRYIALSNRSSGSFTTDIFIYDVVNRTNTQIKLGTGRTFNSAFGLLWSPDDSALAWWRTDAERTHDLQVYTLASATSLRIRVPAFDNVDHFRTHWLWGPYSNTIVWVSVDRQLNRLTLKTGDVSTLASNVRYLYPPTMPSAYPPPGCWPGAYPC
ncbi:MAG: hypothetical protein MUF38_05130 [Anaerolineae bacterium]|nr:hypothetical protein [Anaerolineae bacterium]